MKVMTLVNRIRKAKRLTFKGTKSPFELQSFEVETPTIPMFPKARVKFGRGVYSQRLSECIRCKHRWISRVPDPQRCPRCNFRF